MVLNMFIYNALLTAVFAILLLGNTFAKQQSSGNCQKKKYDRDSFVCVCSAKYCDSPEPLGNFDENQLVYFVSDKAQHRLQRFVAQQNFGNDSPLDNDDLTGVEVRVDDSQQFQHIFGFGGAFTDAAGINLNSLSSQARDVLLRQYFDQQTGIGYSIGRVPIASCDFSAREYSYLDTPNDFNLTTFQLAREDFEAKIPHIQRANEISAEKLLLFASPWAAPGWMKTTGRMKGGGQLKGPFNGKYYRTYAQYFRRFFEEYAKNNITFWGLTIENEPGAGLIPFYGWQAMYLSSEMQRDFAHELLSPELKQSTAGRNVKIMGHDDQRSGILDAAKKIYADPQKATAIDGLGSHWYSKSSYDVLQQVQQVRPDKFILATEACNGYLPWEHKPLLGDWTRGQAYGHDILNNLRNGVVGWTDWNLCLDLQGGPNWVGNFVDAPIIVNASADEFYKQPMFYFLAHFSHFVPRASVVVSSSLFGADGIQLHEKRETRMELPFLGKDKYFLEALQAEMLATEAEENQQQIEHVAFSTPDGHNVVVLLNENAALANQVVIRDTTTNRSWTIPVGPSSIVTAVWKKNGKI